MTQKPGAGRSGNDGNHEHPGTSAQGDSTHENIQKANAYIRSRLAAAPHPAVVSQGIDWQSCCGGCGSHIKHPATSETGAQDRRCDKTREIVQLANKSTNTCASQNTTRAPSHSGSVEGHTSSAYVCDQARTSSLFLRSSSCRRYPVPGPYVQSVTWNFSRARTRNKSILGKSFAPIEESIRTLIPRVVCPACHRVLPK